MDTTKEYDPGVLQNTQLLGPAFYLSLVAGEGDGGQMFQIATRGGGKQNAAIQIPIRIKTNISDDRAFIGSLVRSVREPPQSLRKNFLEVLVKLAKFGYGLKDLELLYVVMPRYGNLISGLEADAPGGTAEIGETRQEVADREWNEEAGLSRIGVLEPFPSYMQFSAGAYDEVQSISFALTVGSPEKLVEGAKSWGAVSLDAFEGWVQRQNNPNDSTGWSTKEFTPLDGKVVLAVLWLIEYLHRKCFSHQSSFV